jgi:hypothetical protein
VASPGQLCEVVARLLGKSLPTVLAYDHQLAKAGLRTTGGRGRSAARMTANDAATLLIVSMTSPTIKDTVVTLESYASLWAKAGLLTLKQNYRPVGEPERLGEAWDLRFMPLSGLTALGADHTFPRFLATLIESATNGEMKLAEHEEHEVRRRHVPYPPSVIVPSLNITLTTPWTRARVSISTTNFEEVRTYNAKGRMAGYVGPTSADLFADYTISDRTIYAISKCLRDEPLGKISSRKERGQTK